MKKTYLLGIKNNSIITAEIEKRNWNGYPEASVCFNSGEAFNIDNIDDNYKKDYYEELWNSYDPAGKLDLLYDGDRTKEDVIEEWAENDSYKDIIDCSCTDYEMDLDNNITINFESTSGGQYDCREDDDFNAMIFTSKKLFNNIMELWDKYHIKKLDPEEEKKVDKLINNIEKEGSQFMEYEEGFYDFIKNNINIGEL